MTSGHPSLDPKPVHQLALHSLLEATNALIVFAKGIGYHKLLIHLIQSHQIHEKLLLVLNTTHEEQSALQHSTQNKGEHLTPLAVLDNETDSIHRMEKYLGGGVIFVTARILVVDLLCNRLPAQHVTGVVVANAHKVTETSNVAFILRMFRQKNSTGFVYALSDDAAGFAHGFSKVEKVMRSLTVSRLLLWPRFHMEVTNWLNTVQPEVEEISVSLSSKAKELQRALLHALDTCVKELRECNPSVDVSQLTTEKALLRTFDSVVRMQLDTISHTASRRTRALVDDLKTLRKLLGALSTHDAVSFFELFEAVIDSVSELPPMERPQWVLQASEAAYVLARERVYVLQRSQLQFQVSRARSPPPMPADLTTAKEGSVAPSLVSNTCAHRDAEKSSIRLINSAATSEEKSDPSLRVRFIMEECPKWKTLLQLLDEVKSGLQTAGKGKALILVRDQRTVATVRALVEHGSNGLLEATLVRWAECRPRANQATKSLISSRQLEATLVRDAARKIGHRHAALANPPKAIHATEWRPGDVDVKTGLQKKRKHVVGRARKTVKHQKPRGNNVGKDGANNKEERINSGDSNFVAEDDAEDDGRDFEVDEKMYEEIANLPGIFLAVHSASSVLLFEELAPSWVIIYDATPAMIRAIEVEQARRPNEKIFVYFIMLSDSSEEQLYRSELQAEKEAFEMLIRARGQMVIPELPVDGVQELPAQLRPNKESVSHATLSGGRAQDVHVMQTVIVDLREFRSSLPNMLHLHGIDVQPMTLEVGDYVLTPDIVVERKTIPDLTQSLASGRLYNQADAMCRYYKRPMLLIECGETKHLSIAGAFGGGLSAEISPTSVHSKLCLLLMHFPRLRLLWSRRSVHTISLFEELKQGQLQPDAKFAASLGAPAAYEASTQVFNMTPQDILRQLPGVHPHNYRRLMNKVDNLQMLSTKTLEQLTEIIGESNAKLLHTFLHRRS